MDTNLKALRYFMSAANSRSISEAAKHMNVVPSAVLAAVNQVEEAFGLKLTTRHRSKGIAPTATGQIIMARIQHLLDEYEALMSQGAEMRTQLVGTLRVGYYAPVSPTFLPAIVRKILADNSRVDIKFIECDTQRAQAGLLSGEFDVILCVAESMHPSVTFETLIEMPAYLLVSKQHEFATRDSVSLPELSGENMVLLDLPIISEYYNRVFEDAEVTPHIACTATTLEMVRSIVGSGIGCSLLHMRPKTNITYAGNKVVQVPLQPAIKPLKLVLGHLPDNPRRVVKYFVDSLREVFSKEDANSLLVTLQD